MALSILGTILPCGAIIENSNSINKSYPKFLEDLAQVNVETKIVSKDNQCSIIVGPIFYTKLGIIALVGALSIYQIVYDFIILNDGSYQYSNFVTY